MPLLQKWEAEGGTWGVWKVTETAEELESILCEKILYTRDLNALKSPKRRMELLGVRVLLKFLAGEEKRILHEPSGKPFLEKDNRRITISHTQGYVAVGIHENAVPGIDIERFGEKVRKVSTYFIREDEMSGAELMSETGCLYQLLLHWSAKETMYKVLERDAVDFIRHLRISPFILGQEGVFTGETLLPGTEDFFRIHYFIHRDFVCTYCIRHG